MSCRTDSSSTHLSHLPAVVPHKQHWAYTFAGGPPGSKWDLQREWSHHLAMIATEGTEAHLSTVFPQTQPSVPVIQDRKETQWGDQNRAITIKSYTWYQNCMYYHYQGKKKENCPQHSEVFAHSKAYSKAALCWGARISNCWETKIYQKTEVEKICLGQILFWFASQVFSAEVILILHIKIHVQVNQNNLQGI